MKLKDVRINKLRNDLIKKLDKLGVKGYSLLKSEKQHYLILLINTT